MIKHRTFQFDIIKTTHVNIVRDYRSVMKTYHKNKILRVKHL